jgi:subtilisin family serine protease
MDSWQVSGRTLGKLAPLSNTGVLHAQVSGPLRHQKGMNRRTLFLPALLGVACTGLVSSGNATPAEPTARIVVAYTSSGWAAAGALERGVDAVPIAAIPQLRVHVLGVPAPRADSVLGELRSSAVVRAAARDTRARALRTPNDELWPGEWSPRKTNAPDAWNLTTGSAAVVVAVVDSGVDASQPDLRGKVVPGYDFVNDDATPGDDNGHGTAVAGVVAAASDNGIGVAGYCWRCRLMPVKVLGADGSGFASTVAQGIVWATDHGARVINASLGGLGYDVADAAAAQYATARGALLVAAAGNDSSAVLDYPAALPGVLSVGASDRHDRLYGFSNSGAAVAAPGENLSTGQNGQYVKFVGTSSATPVVSGIAALALSVAPDASPADLMRGLEQSAVAIPGVAYGRVDAYRAVRALAPGLAPPNAKAGRQRRVLGRLGPRGRTVGITCGPGILRATLTATSRARQPIVLALRQGDRLVASARGRKHVRLRTRVTGGSYRLVVSGVKPPVSFRLTLSCPS